jgi:hypothetical protein
MEIVIDPQSGRLARPVDEGCEESGVQQLNGFRHYSRMNGSAANRQPRGVRSFWCNGRPPSTLNWRNSIQAILAKGSGYFCFWPAADWLDKTVRVPIIIALSFK